MHLQVSRLPSIALWSEHWLGRGVLPVLLRETNTLTMLEIAEVLHLRSSAETLTNTIN